MKLGQFHQYCKEKEKYKKRILQPINCIYCKQTFQPNYSKKKIVFKKMFNRFFKKI